MAFAKLKALLRRAAVRSFDARCANYLKHPGYVQTCSKLSLGFE